MATEVIKIIDPDNGPGTDYLSLSDWEAGEAKDLVAANEQATALCRCTGGTADITAVALDSVSWVTSGPCHVKIWTDPAESYRHKGAYQTGNRYRLETTSANGIVNSKVDHLKIIGLQIQITHSGGGGYVGIYNCTGAGRTYAEQTIFKGVLSGSAQGCRAFRQDAAGGGVYISNCVAHGFIGGGGAHIAFDFYAGAGTDIYCYSNTVRNCNIGYQSWDAPNISIKDCIGQDCGTCYNGTPDTATNNNSDDNTHPGPNGQHGEVQFLDEANDNLHLSSADTVAKNNGANLYMDPHYRITRDIDNQPRGDAPPWDIGADEEMGVVHEGSVSAKGAGLLGTVAAVLVLSASATASGGGLPGAIEPSVDRPGAATAVGSGLLGTVEPKLELGGTATAKGTGLLGTVMPSLILSGAATASGAGLPGTVESALTLSGGATALGRGLLGNIIGQVLGEVLGSATALGIGDLGEITATLILRGTCEAKGAGLPGTVAARVIWSGAVTATGSGALGTVGPNLVLSGASLIKGRGALGDVTPVVVFVGNATCYGRGLIGPIVGTVVPFSPVTHEASATATGVASSSCVGSSSPLPETIEVSTPIVGAVVLDTPIVAIVTLNTPIDEGTEEVPIA